MSIKTSTIYMFENSTFKLPFISVLMFWALISCTQTPSQTVDIKESTRPTKQSAEWAIHWWEKKHSEKRELAKNTQVDLLMLGDSITQLWEDDGAPVWQQYFSHENGFNLGFSGDRTEHVLWRLHNGAVAQMTPKLTVLLIGTNNTGHRMDSANDTSAGIAAIVSELRRQLPTTKILLLAIFPRGLTPEDPMRQRNEAINQHIAKLDDNTHIFFENINTIFVDQHGILKKELMPDLLHPSQRGYERWAEAMAPLMEALLDD